MLKNLSFLNMFVWNLFIIGLWHLIVFIMCVKSPRATFDPKHGRFAPKEWENGGRWYRDKLKIQLWKDKVPQYVGKGEFSKEHLQDISLEYLDDFIMETCRGEWMHLRGALCAVITLLINPLFVGLVFSFLIFLGNVQIGRAHV